jgi:hypothetical protein
VISDDDMRVQLSLIKLGVVTGEMEMQMAFTLWNKHYIVWRRVSNKKHALFITEDGEKFLSS